MNSEHRLSETLFAHVGASAREALASAEDIDLLEQRLNALVGVAQNQWPRVSLSPEAFIIYLAPRICNEKAAELSDLVLSRAGELYLAAACLRGDPTALASFEAAYFSEVEKAVAQLHASTAFVDEVTQMLRHKLFVAQGSAAPKIAEYSGRGELRAWTRIVAMRIGQDLLRSEKREIPVEDDALVGLAEAACPTEDPALQYLKDHYRIPMRDALHEALRTLPSREQNLLRLHHLDGLTMDQIAAIYRAHRVTVVRWVGQARTELLARTRQELQRRLGVSQAELESIVRLLLSNLDVSVRSALEPEEARPQ